MGEQKEWSPYGPYVEVYLGWQWDMAPVEGAGKR